VKIEIISIDRIKEYPNNGRINDKTAAILSELIKKVGFNVPIVIDKAGVIVKGHARYKAAKLLGMSEVPVIISENSDEINDRDRILDNRISELSKWDAVKLTYELDEIGIELKELGLGMIGGEVSHPVTLSEIDRAKGEQEDIGNERGMIGMMQFQCPVCGGYFEHKIYE